MTTINKQAEITSTQATCKAEGIKAAGQTFRQERSQKYGGGFTGNVGIVLAELSARGKVQAELTCLKCNGTHVREMSDWHQSVFCRECKPTTAEKKAAAPTPGAGNGGVGGRSVKVTIDGKEEVIREMTIRPEDDEEMKALKEENNAIFAQLWAKDQARRDAEKAAKDAEKEKAKLLAQKEKLQAIKAESLAKLQRVAAYAQENGLEVSNKTKTEALEAMVAAEESEQQEA